MANKEKTQQTDNQQNTTFWDFANQNPDKIIILGFMALAAVAIITSTINNNKK